MQPYGYALGNPLRLADPTGLFSEEGPGTSNPGIGITFRPGGSGIVIAQPKPVNKPGFVPPSPAVGFQESRNAPQRESDVPPLFNQSKIDRLEMKIEGLQNERSKLEKDIECLATTGMTCMELAVDPLLSAIEEMIDTSKVFEPRPENNPIRLFVIRPHEIMFRQDRIRAIDARIPILIGMVEAERAKQGMRRIRREEF